MRYPVEQFTPEEQRLLAPHFTNLDRPVFALVNLPETVKGALFARYSRYSGSLRRLYLEEFAGDHPKTVALAGEEGARAARLYEQVFVGYGDDSIAQVGGAHVACEWVSNVLTKVLQRGRLAAYLEQSTRYIPYDQPVPGPGGFRFYRDDGLGTEFAAAMNELFEIYSQALPKVKTWVSQRWPREEGAPEGPWQRSVRAKSLDLIRGLLPAATLSHVGIYASGQAYEQLLLRLMASPLPEARAYGTMIREELEKVIPSFVSRVERPDRGGRWVSYLQERRQQADAWSERLELDRPPEAAPPKVELIGVSGSETELLAACLLESATQPEREVRTRVEQLPPDRRSELFAAMVGSRENRRHRPGRGFEAIRYRFEIVSDYGAFRDLQRHRILTCQWQRFTPSLGADVPEELNEAGVGDDFGRGLEISKAEHERLEQAGSPQLAQYALSLAYRIRFTFDLNAREAMHLVELRSGHEGHPSYRAVAQAMHEAIAAVHPGVAAAMTHVDRSREARLERILSEMREHGKAAAAS